MCILCTEEFKNKLNKRERIMAAWELVSTAKTDSELEHAREIYYAETWYDFDGFIGEESE